MGNVHAQPAMKAKKKILALQIMKFGVYTESSRNSSPLFLSLSHLRSNLPLKFTFEF